MSRVTAKVQPKTESQISHNSPFFYEGAVARTGAARRPRRQEALRRREDNALPSATSQAHTITDLLKEEPFNVRGGSRRP